MPHGAVPYPFGDCNVCADTATGVHYGVATCEGCKGFFKRSIPKADRYKCFFGGQCILSPQNRNRCKACRYQRCLRAGMAIDAVKMGRIPKVEKERALQEFQQEAAPGQESPQGSSIRNPPPVGGSRDPSSSSAQNLPGLEGDRTVKREERHLGIEQSAEKWPPGIQRFDERQYPGLGGTLAGFGVGQHDECDKFSLAQSRKIDESVPHNVMDASTSKVHHSRLGDDMPVSIKTEDNCVPFTCFMNRASSASDAAFGSQAPSLFSTRLTTVSSDRPAPFHVNQAPQAPSQHPPAPQASSQYPLVPQTLSQHHLAPQASSQHPLAPQAPSQHHLPTQAPSHHPLAPQAPSQHPLATQTPSQHPPAPQTPSQHPATPQPPNRALLDSCGGLKSLLESSDHKSLTSACKLFSALQESLPQSRRLPAPEEFSSTPLGSDGRSVACSSPEDLSLSPWDARSRRDCDRTTSRSDSDTSSQRSTDLYCPRVIKELIVQVLESGQGDELERTLRRHLLRRSGEPGPGVLDPSVTIKQEPGTDTAQTSGSGSVKQTALQGPHYVGHSRSQEGHQGPLSHISETPFGCGRPQSGSGVDRRLKRSLSDCWQPTGEVKSKALGQQSLESEVGSDYRRDLRGLDKPRISQAYDRHYELQPSGSRDDDQLSRHTTPPHYHPDTHRPSDSWDGLPRPLHYSTDGLLHAPWDMSAPGGHQRDYRPGEYHSDEYRSPAEHRLTDLPAESMFGIPRELRHTDDAPDEVDDITPSIGSLSRHNSVVDLLATGFPTDAENLEGDYLVHAPDTDPRTDPRASEDAEDSWSVDICELKVTIDHIYHVTMRQIRRSERLMELQVHGRLPIHPINKLKVATRKQVQYVWDGLMSVIPDSNKTILEFCSLLPHFTRLPKEDQSVLIREAYFDIWLISHSRLFHKGETFLRLKCNGTYSRWWMSHILPDPLISKMYMFAESLNECGLTGEENVLLCAIQLTSPDREGLMATARIRDMNNRYLDILAYIIEENHRPSHGRILVKIFRLLPMLKDINAQQAEVIGNFKVDSFPESVVYVNQSDRDEEPWDIDLNFPADIDPPEDQPSDGDLQAGNLQTSYLQTGNLQTSDL